MKNWKESLKIYKEQLNEREKDEKRGEELIKAAMGEDVFERDDKNNTNFDIEKSINNKNKNLTNKNMAKSSENLKRYSEQEAQEEAFIMQEKMSSGEAEKGEYAKTEKLAEAEVAQEKTKGKFEMAQTFNMDNRGTFEKLSDSGKEAASSLWGKGERGANRVIAGAEILFQRMTNLPGWNKRRLDRNIEKQTVVKVQLQAMDKALFNLEQRSTRAYQTPAGRMAFENQKHEIEAKKMQLQNKSDTLESKIKHRNNNLNIFTNERNEICKGYKNQYEGILRPLENELQHLNEYRKSMDNQIDSIGASKDLSIKEMNDTERTYLEAGFKGKQLKNMMKGFQEELRLLNDSIKNIEKQRGATDKRVAKLDKRANPYRDEINRFARITQLGPVLGEEGTKTKEAVGERKEIKATAWEGGDKESGEQQGEFGADEWLTKWNEYAMQTGGKLISKKTFERFLANTLSGTDRKMDNTYFKRYLESFFSQAGVIDKNYTKDKFGGDFKKFAEKINQ